MRFCKKNVITASLAVTLAAAAVLGGGTYAYLQSNTDDTVNTFNTNQVTVSLEETTGSEYEIIPGTSQDKDPTVKVNNTLDAYVFVSVRDTTDGMVTYEIADGWTLLDGYTGVYYREVAADAPSKDFAVLKDNTVFYSAELENSDMLNSDGSLKDGLELTFKAYAIQSDTFGGDVLLAYGYASGTVAAASEDITKAVTDANNADEPVSIVLGDDIELDSPITLKSERGVTFLGEGKTVTGKPIYIETGGDAVISGIDFNNGTEGNESSVYVTNKSDADNLVIENCTFKNAKWDSIQLTNPNFNSIIIRNNTFENTEKGYRYIHLEFRNGGAYAASDTKLTLTGNTFINITKDYCGDSAVTLLGFYFDNMDIADNIVMGENAESIDSASFWICNGTNFSDLYTDEQVREAFAYAEAIDSAETLLEKIGDGGKFVLTNDIVIDSTTSPNGSGSGLGIDITNDVDLILNSRTVTGKEGTVADGLFDVKNGATVNVYGNDNTYVDSADMNYTFYVQDGGTLNIYGGRYNGSAGGCVFAAGENISINIYGGMFSCEEYNGKNYVLNKLDKQKDLIDITVYGGTFVNLDPSNNNNEDPPQNQVAAGYKVISEVQPNGDIWYTVVPESN